MTRKRFKFGLAALVFLTAFLMAIIGLLFGPTFASADKGSGTSYKHDGDGKSGPPNPVYFQPPDSDGPNQHGHHTFADDVAPCSGAACGPKNDGAPDGGDGIWHFSDGQGGEGQGGSGGGGHGSDHGSGDNGGSGPFAGGWNPGGGSFGGDGSGGGAPQGNANTCPSDKSNDKNSGKTGKDHCDKDAGNGSDGDPSGNGGHHDYDPPSGPNDFPFDSSFDGGSNNNNDGGTPNTLTDPPVQVPEPFTLSLFAAGLAGAAVARRRARSK